MLCKTVISAIFLVKLISGVQSITGGYPDSLQNLEYGAPQNSGSGYGNEPANYDFEYEVYGGDNYFGHKESRRDQKTNGKYHVLLPDGRLQVVTYVADETGYHPTVTYDESNTGGYGASPGVTGGYGSPVNKDNQGGHTGPSSGGYEGSSGVSGGYGSPVNKDNNRGHTGPSSGPHYNRFSSRIKRQFHKDVPLEENYTLVPDSVQVYRPRNSPNQVFRKRNIRRISAPTKKSYLIVYPD